MKNFTAIHSAAQVRALDRYAIDELGIPGITLMNRAGAAAFTVLRDRWPAAKRLLIVCGFGNNAGDGYVVARLARAQKLDVTVIALGDPPALKGDAQLAYQEFTKAGGVIVGSTTSPHSSSARVDPVTGAGVAEAASGTGVGVTHIDFSTDEAIARAITGADVIVDAIFGTGLNRSVEPLVEDWIHTINAATAPILCLDIPSGLDATSGQVLGVAVRGYCTITFVGLKSGCYLGEGPNYTGAVLFDDLQIPPREQDVTDCVAELLTPRLLAEVLPKRPRISNKGTNGHVLIVGGGPGMPGAARLAGEAALRSGAGLVSVATHPQNLTAIAAGRPELICHGIADASDLAPLLERATVIAVGPGLGQDPWAVDIFETVLATNKPLVVDADALNLLARRFNSSSREQAHSSSTESPGQISPEVSLRRADWILTPHPGEAARLLGMTVPDVQNDRLAAARKLIDRYGGFAILKGAGSLVVGEGKLPAICDRGNPGMAAAGMGDILTGVVAAIAAQTKTPWEAARAGVLAHAMAGDLAAAVGERGLIASDLFPHIVQCVNLKS